MTYIHTNNDTDVDNPNDNPNDNLNVTNDNYPVKEEDNEIFLHEKKHNVDHEELNKLCKKIEALDYNHHIQIGFILKNNNIRLNENNNGIFINMNNLSVNVINQINDYLNFINKQDNFIDIDEQTKNNLQTSYFNEAKKVEEQFKIS